MKMIVGDAFINFLNIFCFKINELDCVYFLSPPELARQATLK